MRQKYQKFYIKLYPKIAKYNVYTYLLLGEVAKLGKCTETKRKKKENRCEWISESVKERVKARERDTENRRREKKIMKINRTVYIKPENTT